MEVFINPGEEEKVVSLGYKDRIKFICQNCNKEVIISNKYNFRNLFCKKCNMIKTSQEKYGTNNPAQSSASIEKQKLTKANKTDEEKKSIDNKKKRSMLIKYGVDNPAKSKEIYNKIRKTNNEKYGEIGFASTELKAKADETCIRNHGIDISEYSQKLAHKALLEKKIMVLNSSVYPKLVAH